MLFLTGWMNIKVESVLNQKSPYDCSFIIYHQPQNNPIWFIDSLIYDGIIWINWPGKRITFDLQDKMLLIER